MSTVHAGLFRFVLASGLLAASALFAWPLAAAEGQWIVDPASRCGTTSSFITSGENIRWYGGCRDGKLHGKGTLVWYNGQIETERNEGAFRNGEFHGDVLTTFPDGRAVYGQYWTGVRHGQFLVVKANSEMLRVTYDKGRLKSRNPISASEARDWQQRRRQRLAAAPRPAATPPATVATAAAPQTGGRQRAAPAAAPDRRAPQAMRGAAPETHGFWSRVNPLNWGVGGFVSGLFGGNDDGAKTAATARAPRTRTVAAARAPKKRAVAARRPAPVRPPVRVASSRAAAPIIQPAVYRPAATASGGRVYGKAYDMNALLDEPHPFAGNRTPWAAPGASNLTGYQPVPTAATGQAPMSWRGPQPVPRAVPHGAIAPRTPPAQAADRLFVQGYGLESTGDRGGAATVYEQVSRRYPTTRAAGLARARLNLVRRTVAPAARPAATGQPNRRRAAAPAGVTSGAQIVATNTPFPQAAAASGISGSRALSMFANSPWLQQNVCSRKGIYAGKTGWCGRVLRDDGEHLLVEVQMVRLFGFGTIGISRSTCTGGALLTWFSRGTTIRVPKKCLAAAG